ncbi:MAG: ATP-binding cassette domain-containing protein [Rhodobacterales bacterium]|nr:ATP-binding cassette domain-containing protein [Rhodobacterales bacterium]
MHHLGQRLHAFDGVSFTVHAGEFLLLKGPNGVGKSTLLRTIWRSYPPEAGQLWFTHDTGRIDLARAADVDIAVLRRRQIGFVTQFLIARPRVPAEEIVSEPLRRAGQPDRPHPRPGPVSRPGTADPAHPGRTGSDARGRRTACAGPHRGKAPPRGRRGGHAAGDFAALRGTWHPAGQP